MGLMAPSAPLLAVELNSIGVQESITQQSKNQIVDTQTFINNFQGQPNWRRPPKNIVGKLLSRQGSTTAVVVLAENISVDDANSNNKYCQEPFSKGTFNGEIVVCQQSDFSTEKIVENVKAAGASGLIIQAMSLKEIDTPVIDSFPSVSADLDAYFLIKNWVNYSKPGTAIATIGD